MNSQLSSLVRTSGANALSEERDKSASPSDPKRRLRDWRSRLATALPWLLVVGFFAMLALVLGNRLLPARDLAVATVVTVRQDTKKETSTPEADAAVSAGQETVPFDAPMLFQASGWIEPDPYPTLATALTDGVVESVGVLEGEKVKRGQLLASFIAEDSELNLRTAQSQLASLKAQAAAQQRLIELAEAEIVTLEKQVNVAQARSNEAADILERLRKVSSGGVAVREVSEAQLKLTTMEAEVDALAVTEGELKVKVDQLREVLSDFDARIAEAETDVARKQLALDRTRIKSPIDGRVLRLMVVPGQKRMLHGDNPESATIAVLYNPEELQARIDVPLAEAAQLEVGQPVRIRTELLQGIDFRGRVTRIAGEADLQRNTLQAKVAIENPDERLRPEMLCRAEFLGFPGASSGDSGQRRNTLSRSDRINVFVPSAAFVGGAGSDENVGAARVWKVDATGERVKLQAVTLGREERDGHRLVLEGLKPGDRVVLNPPPDLEAGERFRRGGSANTSNTQPDLNS